MECSSCGADLAGAVCTRCGAGPSTWPVGPAARTALLERQAHATETVAPAARRRRRPVPWVPLAVVAVALFVLAAVVLVQTRTGDTRALPPRPSTTKAPLTTATPAPATSTPPPTPAPAPPDPPAAAVPTTLAPPVVPATLSPAEVARVRLFVEQARGLPFKRTVPVEVLGDADYRALVSRSGPPPGLSKADGDALAALGAIPSDLDLPAAAAAQLGAGEGGRYLPATGVVSLRSGPTAALLAVLAHELTHALDDQWFGIDRPVVRLDGDRSLAFTALVEGSATWVEDRWVESTGAVPTGGARPAAPGIPAVVARMLSFPYVEGPPLIDALRRAGGAGGGGSKKVDEAFAMPPRSTEQVIHPERYLAGDEPVVLPDPPSSGEVVARDSFGEQRLLLTLAPAVGEPDAVTAATGWGGGRSVTWQDAGVECFRATLKMDTPKDTTEVVAALRRWEQAGDGRLVSDDGLTLTSCKMMSGSAAPARQ